MLLVHCPRGSQAINLDLPGEWKESNHWSYHCCLQGFALGRIWNWLQNWNLNSSTPIWDTGIPIGGLTGSPNTDLLLWTFW